MRKFWRRKDEWFSYAACYGSIDHTLPPIRTDGGPVALTFLVRALCNRCTVRPECATWAYEGSESGVWVCGTWIPGHDEDKRLANELRHKLFQSVEGEASARGQDV